ncbi:MAG TPA: hypothetical protein VFU19_11500 [Iamia sp.]|nr:hypothetical protein [Iamia sp.]
MNRRNVHRWRHEGLTVAQADHLAILLGHHPSAIWGDAWWTTDPPDGDGADPSPLGHTTDLIGAAA